MTAAVAMDEWVVWRPASGGDFRTTRGINVPIGASIEYRGADRDEADRTRRALNRDAKHADRIPHVKPAKVPKPPVLAIVSGPVDGPGTVFPDGDRIAPDAKIDWKIPGVELVAMDEAEVAEKARVLAALVSSPAPVPVEAAGGGRLRHPIVAIVLALGWGLAIALAVWRVFG